MREPVLAWVTFPSGRSVGCDLGVSPPALVWTRDPDGTAHLDVPELLRAAGVVDTPANRDVAVGAALRAVSTAWPGVPVRVERAP